MNSFDNSVADRLHDLVDGDFDAAPPVGAVLDRAHTASRRRSRVRVTVASLGVLAVAGVAGVAAIPRAGQPAAAGQSDAVADTPLVRLQAAVSTSENVSYRIKVTNTYQYEPAASVPPTFGTGSENQVSTGAFDPATDTGYLHTPADDGPGFTEERLVNGTLYAGSAGIDQKVNWLTRPGRHTALDLVGSAASGLSATADPTALLGNLGQEGATVTQTGSDTYHFTVDVPKQDLVPGSISDKFVGDVRVGPDKRIASVRYERIVLWEPKPGSNRPNVPADWKVSMDFSDYGTPVVVEAPTDAAPAK